MNLLEVFNIETATIPFTGNSRHNLTSKDPFLDTIIHQDEFQSFIENKLFNITNIIELYGEDLQEMALFKECFLKIYSALNLTLYSFYNKLNKNEELIKKINLEALGILFCRGKNISKIKLFFDLFKNDNNKFTKPENLDNYLMSCFFIASCCLVLVRALVDNEGKSLHAYRELIIGLFKCYLMKKDYLKKIRKIYLNILIIIFLEKIKMN